jgi:fructose-1,6-bisphosphatase/sedoheptulose 1,7-bisphosphatase-like protein
MAPQKNVAIEPALLEQAGKVAAAEGKTVDELATDALKRELARRALETFRRDAEPRRRGMTDADVAATVEQAVHESRAARRGA